MNTCIIEGCSKKSRARGWCTMHYQRWKSNGNPLINQKPTGRICCIDGCDKKHKSNGYCSQHEANFKRNGNPITDLKRYDTFLDAYNYYVIKNKEGCWGWSGSKLKTGYTKLSCKGKKLLGHRFSYELYNEPIKNGNIICHHCDNPVCTRPDHLFQGTLSDNMQDCIFKNRFNYEPNEKILRGEQIVGSKLKDYQVVDIKKMIENGAKQTDIARMFGVARKTISAISTGQNWRHIK